jgi:hypothetical protein
VVKAKTIACMRVVKRRRMLKIGLWFARCGDQQAREILMARFGILFLSLVVLSAPSAGREAQITDQRSVSTTHESIQFAQVGRCKDFGKQQKCRATWDMRD